MTRPNGKTGWIGCCKLPLWLDLGSCRVVHAAWDDAAVQACGTRDTLAEDHSCQSRKTPDSGGQCRELAPQGA